MASPTVTGKGRDGRSYEVGSAASKTSAIGKPYSSPIDIPTSPGEDWSGKGNEALFNRWYSFFYTGPVGGGGTQPVNYFEDEVGWDARMPRRNPTASNLIAWSRGGGGQNSVEYSWEDFLYAKNYGRVPNNYMITLRRFGTPVGDNLLNPARQGAPDIGRLISWMDGEKNKLADLMKFSYKVKWKEFKSEIQTLNGGGHGGAGSGSMLGKILQATDTAGSKVAGKGVDRSNVDPYGSEKNKTLGPINVIDKMMVRERGMEFNQQLALTFEYEMRSIDGIDGKVAFLDLLMNVLMVTYNRGEFWGGAIRYTGGKQKSNPLAGQEGMEALGRGDFGGFLDGLSQGLTSRLNDLTGGKGFSLEGIGNAIKSVGANVGMRMAGEAGDSMGRPQAQAANALLTGEDTGEWHVQIGNPTQPMLSVGNMILENTEIIFDGPLSVDDFPTKMTVKCTLKPARPRDRDDIQMMFVPNNGNRLYASAMDFIKNTYYGQVPAAGGRKHNAAFNTTPNKAMASGNQVADDTENVNLGSLLANRFPNHGTGNPARTANIEAGARWTT